MKGFEDQPIDWSPACVWTTDDGVRHQRLEFIVPGLPVPKGNVIKGRWGGYHDPTKGLDDWLTMVSSQASAAMRGNYRARLSLLPEEEYRRERGIPTPISLPIFTSAVRVDVTFALRRPKSTIIDGVRWNLTKEPTPPHTKKPDRDKLLRAVGDAMTGIVYVDDSQVIAGDTRKRYAYLGETTGALIIVTSDVEVV